MPAHDARLSAGNYSSTQTDRRSRHRFPMSMLLAINYSQPASQLLSSGQIQIERFKCPDWPDMIAEARRQLPVAVHFTLQAGRRSHAGGSRLEQTDWEQIERLLEQTGTTYVNLHLESRLSDFPEIPLASDNPDHREQILEAMIADLRLAVKRFGPQRVIAENIPYRPAGKVLRLSVEPQVIQQALEETGAGLLLDIAHARISAFHLGMDERAYIAQLPVERLRELHFTGVHDLDGWLQDHLPALAADWQALDWVLESIRRQEWPMPGLLAFEYGGVGERFADRSDPQVIAAQATTLAQKITYFFST